MIICAAGDIHGAIDRMYEDVLAFEVAVGVRFECVLHVGDFGIWPDASRVDKATKNTMARVTFPRGLPNGARRHARRPRPTLRLALRQHGRSKRSREHRSSTSSGSTCSLQNSRVPGFSSAVVAVDNRQSRCSELDRLVRTESVGKGDEEHRGNAARATHAGAITSCYRETGSGAASSGFTVRRCRQVRD